MVLSVTVEFHHLVIDIDIKMSPRSKGSVFNGNGKWVQRRTQRCRGRRTDELVKCSPGTAGMDAGAVWDLWGAGRWRWGLLWAVALLGVRSHMKGRFSKW